MRNNGAEFEISDIWRMIGGGRKMAYRNDGRGS